MEGRRRSFHRFASAGTLGAVLLGTWLSAGVARAQTYQVLHHFTGNDGHGFNGDTDGANPAGPLVQGPDGNFYGTTVNGSASATGPTGTVFKMDASGKVTILHHFLILANGDAVHPYAGLIRASDGNFYGTTWDSLGEPAHGGGGAFKIDASGTYTKLHTFVGPEGAGPYAGLIQASDGNFYGTTTRGGGLKGTVFKMDSSGATTSLYSFTDEGSYNHYKSGVIEATDGNLYGTTYGGGTNAVGTVFRLTPDGVYTRLHEFKGTPGLDGALPFAELTQASDGNFYGTTSAGGLFNYGTVFRMTPAGVVTVLHSFNYTDGANPRAPLLQATDGRFYGTTYAGGDSGYGTVFKITPAGVLRTLHSFTRNPAFQPTSDGLRSEAALIEAADGKLYGTTMFGGSQNKGVVFRLIVGLLPGRDFDGDGVTDISVYRPSTGEWFVKTSRSQFASSTTVKFGGGSDVPVRGDFDRDGKRDVAVYRPVSGTWFWLASSTKALGFKGFGVQAQGDVPVPGDYDGDGRTDLAVFRPAFGTWFILKSSSNYTTYFSRGWGASSDVRMPGDYDGDGATDIAVYRPSSGQWFVLPSSSGFNTGRAAVTFGQIGDIPVHGDFDGDGKQDLAVYRPSTGTWFWLKSSTNNKALGFKGFGVQAQDDVPVPGDYDGDGKADPTVFRPAFGTWFVLKSSTNYTTFVSFGWGNASDIPLGGQR